MCLVAGYIIYGFEVRNLTTPTRYQLYRPRESDI